MGREELLKTLKGLKSPARKKYKAELKGVFGSFARGEETANSDIDILVAFAQGATLFDLARLGFFLEEKLQRKVDIVSERAVRKELSSQIYNDLITL